MPIVAEIGVRIGVSTGTAEAITKAVATTAINHKSTSITNFIAKDTLFALLDTFWQIANSKNKVLEFNPIEAFIEEENKDSETVNDTLFEKDKDVFPELKEISLLDTVINEPIFLV